MQKIVSHRAHGDHREGKGQKMEDRRRMTDDGGHRIEERGKGARTDR